MPHEDGNAYYPLVATVSLGAPVVLDLYRKDNAQDEEERKREEEEEEEEEKEGLRFRVLQEERSLLVLSEEIYERFLHGIGDLRVDEELRDGEGGIVNWGLVGEKERFEKGWWERGTRVSLTYRDVRKVVRVGDALKFMGGKR
ncbi:MAG: hypothetical protein M1812_002653 [Candelaria pacifica]|nr:MAG: hypothetical protein M1812_002653 [Candelaria pacifica]